ncbi:DNA-binding CsgD family transcriptional regulator [Streptomyces aurantiacus]|uniref:helix-turn-helix transcriptional regulator n=1 Tax=Streptomyces aurantiacus TaxID=47760 RepID=UPI00279340A7|nr:helix-turn-helix transcriptional regulator [Streptomyces aurantiacus]MDQ0779829.1 DNA-binding CsgD family transcriptional regulator [Streptomyces aurantiacus]
MVWSGVHRAAGPPMVGRHTEREAIGRLLESVHDGFSGVLVLTGDAGVGKSRLLEYAAQSAQDLTVVRLVGVEAETRLGYGALHRLLRPYLGRLPALPQRQRDALNAAFGLTDAAPSDRHLVGLAALTLLSDAATAAPMLCLVDDVQWLDRESAETLAFVGRRLYADCLGLLFAGRDGTGDHDVFDALPTLGLEGLADGEARALLTDGVTGHLDQAVAEQLVAGTGGNPLALLELAVNLGSEQLAGITPLPEPLPLNRQLEEHFRRTAALLPADTRTLLLLMATTPTDDRATLWRAAGALGLSIRSATPAVAAGILNRGTTVEFRHPLIRSAVHSAAPAEERRRIQAALAATSAPERSAWHLAEATDGPDDSVAAMLEAASELAQARGGYSEQALVLTRAAELTAQPGKRAERYLDAAAAHLTSGNLPEVRTLLELTAPDLTGPAARVHATRLRASVEMFSARPREVPAMLLDAAADLGSTDPVARWDLLREATYAAIVGGRLITGTTIREVAEAAADGWCETASPAWSPDPLIAALARSIAYGYAAGAPALAAALARLRTADDLQEQGAFSVMVSIAGDELWDIEAKREILGKLVTADRGRGALYGLSMALLSLATVEIWDGRFAAAESCYTEADDYMAATGFRASGDFHKALLYAWTGREAELRAAIATMNTMAEQLGIGSTYRWSGQALSIFELGRGRYREALDALLAVFDHDPLALGDMNLAGMVEAGLRAGDRKAAAMAMERMEERAPLAGTPWALGLLARCRALTTDDDGAEQLYHESIAQLGKVPVAVELAWSRLLFGEWLRRRRRRADARVQLRAAYESFESWGATPFAERARVELLATGETARKRTVDTQFDLTPQELRVAIRAASGSTNTEIATQLFVTISTIEFHLSRVFRKLGITSRKQIGLKLSTTDSGD